jgi:hypothetical protein
MDIKSLKAVIIPAKFMEGVNSTKFNLYNYIRLVLTQLGVTIPTPPANPVTVKYIAGIMTQTLTDNPQVLISYRSDFGNYVIERNSVGSYTMWINDPIGTQNVSVLFGANPTNINRIIYGKYNPSNNTVEITCKDTATNANVDIQGSNINFEVKAFV